MYIICININVEKEMKNKKEFYAMQFEKLGFKKVPTEDGFFMYELTPARLDTIKAHDQQPLTTKEYNRIKNVKKK